MPYTSQELDQTVSIQRPSRVPDGTGGHVVTMQTIATVRAHLRPKSGRERGAFGGIEASAMYHCVMREPVDIREEDTVVWNGVGHNVRFVARRGRALFVEVDLERGVAL